MAIATYSVGGDGDETAHLEHARVDRHRKPPVKIGVIGSCDHVDSGHVLVHRRQHQLLHQSTTTNQIQIN